MWTRHQLHPCRLGLQPLPMPSSLLTMAATLSLVIIHRDGPSPRRNAIGVRETGLVSPGERGREPMAPVDDVPARGRRALVHAA